MAIPLGVASMVIQSIIWAYLYSRLFSGEPVLRGALKFAALAFPLAWSFLVLPIGAKHLMADVQGFVLIETAFVAVQYLIVSPLIALAFATQGAEAAASSVQAIHSRTGHFACPSRYNRSRESLGRGHAATSIGIWRRRASSPLPGCSAKAARAVALEACRHRACHHHRHRRRPAQDPAVVAAFAYVNQAVGAIAAATRAGTSFVFGYLGGGPLPYDLKMPGAEFVLALQALPVLLVMSVLTTLLFYWRILPPVVRGFSWALERTIGVGGAVGLATATNIFVGHVEAPLFIRPYLARLTRTELFIVMTGGMAGIAGTVLVLYATMLGPVIPDAAAHLVIASVLGAPAAILISLIMVPETAERADRRRSHRAGAGGVEHHGRDREGHRRRPRAAAHHLRHADRAGGAGPSRQCHPRPAARRRRRAALAATHARLDHGAGHAG